MSDGAHSTLVGTDPSSPVPTLRRPARTWRPFTGGAGELGEGRAVTPNDRKVSLTRQLLAECQAMSAYALTSGLRVPSSVLEQVEFASSQPAGVASADATKLNIKRLTQAHDQLVHIVAPATPRTLMLLEHERTSGKASPLGPVRLIRHMMVASGILLVLFLAAPMDPAVTPNVDIFKDNGLTLFINEVFLLSAAGIGATFAGLFKAYRYVGRGTYDPKYESSYWIRFVLGLIAGIILASLVPIKASGGSGALSKPFLALIGGFSASVLFRILNRAVSTLENLVQGDSEDADDGAKTRTAHAEAVAQRTQDQMRVGAGLIKLREQMAAGVTQEQLTANVNKLLDDLLPAELASDQPQASPTEGESDPVAALPPPPPPNGA